MKITSADNVSLITIQPPKEGSNYTGFEVVILADLVHGQFVANNKDVHFLNLDTFVGEFDNFISDRSLTPRLTATYDTFLEFKKSDNSLICKYSLGDAFSGRKITRHCQSGEFTIEQECLLELFRGFKALLAQQRL